ncbi:MAG: hypothetical protein JSS02_14505 [Planctomycetes bacterium]|nr:hypothetical protein [Planctomycetota bacterium]
MPTAPPGVALSPWRIGRLGWGGVIWVWFATTITHSAVIHAGVLHPTVVDETRGHSIDEGRFGMLADHGTLGSVSAADPGEWPAPASPVLPEHPEPATPAVEFADFHDADASDPTVPSIGSDAEAPATLDTAAHHRALAATARQRFPGNELAPDFPPPGELLDPPRSPGRSFN